MAIQLDPETYLREPQGPKEEYDTWLNDFNLEDRKGDISELLVANADVRLLYTQMVIHVVHFQDLLLKSIVFTVIIQTIFIVFIILCWLWKELIN